MSKKTYDNLKIISLIIPIIITATIELQHIFGFTPIIAEVMGVVETALISILKISSDKYFSDKSVIESADLSALTEALKDSLSEKSEEEIAG